MVVRHCSNGAAPPALVPFTSNFLSQFSHLTQGSSFRLPVPWAENNPIVSIFHVYNHTTDTLLHMEYALFRTSEPKADIEDETSESIVNLVEEFWTTLCYSYAGTSLHLD